MTDPQASPTLLLCVPCGEQIGLRMAPMLGFMPTVGTCQACGMEAELAVFIDDLDEAVARMVENAKKDTEPVVAGIERVKELRPGMVGHSFVDDLGDVWVWKDVTPWWRRLADFVSMCHREDIRPRLAIKAKNPKLPPIGTKVFYVDKSRVAKAIPIEEYLAIRNRLIPIVPEGMPR